MSKVNLSAVIITYNEEKNIERCIKSIGKMADEILVVDSFSDDKTEKICKKLNVKFIQNKFKGHIEQKNFAIKKAKYDWVLSLDADEALSKELKESISTVLDNPKLSAYRMNRLTNYCGKWIKHCGWYPDSKIRLFDRNIAQWGGINPHDKIILKENTDLGFLKGDILHYTVNSISEHINVINKYSQIAAEHSYKEGKRTNIFGILIRTITKFIRDYFLKLGFLDGYYGLVICVNSAHSKFLKYTKIYELQKKSSD